MAPTELGIDFGTSTTVGVLRRDGGDVRPLLFDGTPLLPSAVYADTDGGLLVGRDAIHSSRMDPGRLEPSPKRRIGEGTVLLGEREFPALALVATVLGRVAEEAERVAGTPDRLVLTHPANWGSARRGLLADAARLVGLPEPSLVPEPLSAAGYFTEGLGHRIEVGSAVVVYDFGAGTFDVSVVVRGADGLGTSVSDGLDDLGGLDIDAAVVDRLGERYGSADPTAWQRLTRPASPAEVAHRQDLWRDVRYAKELLSRSPQAPLAIPALQVQTHLTRAELEELAAPLVDRTVQTTTSLLRQAGLTPDRIAGIFLVGGSSRLPLVAATLHRRTGIAPTVIEQPELVVAEGSLLGARTAPAAAPTSPPPAPTSPAPASPAPTSPALTEAPTVPSPVVHRSPAPPARRPAPPARQAPAGRPAPPRRRGRWRRRILGTLAALVVLAVLGAGGMYLLHEEFRGASASPRQSGGAGPTTPASSAAEQFPPSGWKQVIDDSLAGDGAWKAHNSQNGNGKCQPVSGGMHVTMQRSQSGMMQCFGPQQSYQDVAVRATMKVADQCAGVWLRTGSEEGYFLDICGDSVVLHLVSDKDPDQSNALQKWPLSSSSVGRNLTLDAQVVGTTITVFADGAQIGTAQDSRIDSGRVDIGVFTGTDNSTADVTFSHVTVWTPQ